MLLAIGAGGGMLLAIAGAGGGGGGGATIEALRATDLDATEAGPRLKEDLTGAGGGALRGVLDASD